MTIKEYMENAGLTYRGLSKLWGVGTTTIHHWVHKRSKPLEKHKKLIVFKTKGLISLEDL